MNFPGGTAFAACRRKDLLVQSVLSVSYIIGAYCLYGFGMTT